MDKIHFDIKLIPGHPTFAKDTTTEERGIMQQHVIYWRGMMDKGAVIVFCPVLDPKDAYGLGIVKSRE